TKLFIVIPYASGEAFLSSETKLMADANYVKAADAYLNAPATDPAYTRIESSLMKSFTGMAKLEAPEKKSRIFELRRYESASESAGKKKIQMFNESEISVFRRVGLTPVFFGETLIGELRPNLTYMITFDDMDEHDANWKTFGSDAEWKKISSVPEYADAKIVSNITRTFLEPTDFSQI
ncbi:MAG: NIPSNAP family containing protein, partial [Proteobacteria bacterium]